MKNRAQLFSPNSIDLDHQSEISLRPKSLEAFVGQESLKSNLAVFINASKARSLPLDHVIFYGPPGLGKTTLSQIIAHELGVALKSTSGPAITKAGELAAILTNLKPGDVLFIDEIHRLNKSVEEILYSAMEDFQLDLTIGEGQTARSVKLKLPRFTLIGATTRLGMLSKPLKDRFGIPLKLDFYNTRELSQIVDNAAFNMDLTLSREASNKLAECSRGTPRIALRLTRRISDFAIIQSQTQIDIAMIEDSLEKLGIDAIGLDNMDYKYIYFIANNYNGGPVGIETIAAGLSEDRGTLEDVVEPYLMSIGFLERTSKGRALSQSCINYMSSAARIAK